MLLQFVCQKWTKTLLIILQLQQVNVGIFVYLQNRTNEIGWGYTSQGSQPDYLQEISVQIEATCYDTVPAEGQFCASSETGNVCSKDEVFYSQNLKNASVYKSSGRTFSYSRR